MCPTPLLIRAVAVSCKWMPKQRLVVVRVSTTAQSGHLPAEQKVYQYCCKKSEKHQVLCHTSNHLTRNNANFYQQLHTLRPKKFRTTLTVFSDISEDGDLRRTPKFAIVYYIRLGRLFWQLYKQGAPACCACGSFYINARF